jgi:hypothetical protein
MGVILVAIEFAPPAGARKLHQASPPLEAEMEGDHYGLQGCNGVTRAIAGLPPVNNASRPRRA